MNRRKLAELTSSLGALVLGIGLGAMFAPWITGTGVTIAAVGVIAHAFGMWDGHRQDTRSHIHNPAWVVALYVLCWVLLAAVLLALLLNRRAA